MRQGRHIPRDPRDRPQCHLCPAGGRWTPENRELYRRWVLHRAGVETGPLGEEEAVAFFRLEDESREIDQVTVARIIAKWVRG